MVLCNKDCIPCCDFCIYAIHDQFVENGIKKGDKVVVTAGVPLGVSGNTNMIRVVEV